jgi:hypothetical protein
VGRYALTVAAQPTVGVLRSGVSEADNKDMSLHPVPSSVQHPVMSALVHRVPLTLLLDLASPAGPESARILARETADLSWLSGLPCTVTADRSLRPVEEPGR